MARSTKRVAFWSLVILLATNLSATSLADPLFESQYTGTEQTLRLNSQAFNMEPGDQLSLPDMGGQNFDAEFVRAETSLPGGRLWVGRISSGEEHHRVIITEGANATFGMFVTPGGVWTLAPEYAGGPLVMRPDSLLTADPDREDFLALSPDDIAASVEALDVAHGNLLNDDDIQNDVSENTVAVGSNGIVDVGIVYTPEHAALYGIAVLTRLQHLVNLYDQALIDSDTGMRARLAHAGPIPVPWDELTTTAQTLDDLLAGASYGNAGTSEDATGTCLLADDGEPCVNDGDLSSLFALRNEKALDVIVFVRRYHRINSGGCGIAMVSARGLGQLDPATEHVNGVVVLSDGIDVDGTGTQCADVILAHEIGHNMGLLHNLEWSGDRPGVHDYSYGYQATCQFKTIQSYDSSGSVVCEDNNPPTRANELRLVRYSNPDQNDCQDQACGIHLPDGAVADIINGPVATDSARSLRMAGRNVSQFRDPPAPSVRSAVLPYSRTVQVGQTATAFVSIVNPASSGSTATNCGLMLHGANTGEFSYQTTDPATNATTGSVNTPVDIPAGGAQSFVISLNRPAMDTEADLSIDAQCLNRQSAPSLSGVNTFQFFSTLFSLADIVALSATVGNTGYVELPSATGVGAFSVATSNLGALSNVVVSASPASTAQEMGAVEVCRTDPVTSVCQTPRSPSLTQLFQAGETLTFAVFVRGTGQIDNDPGNNRIFVNFRSPGGQSVGATSVAVRTTQP